MKYSVFYDENREEEVLIYAHRENELVERIEALLNESRSELVGYSDDEIVKIDLDDVYCFTVENGKLFAVMGNGRLQIRSRLYCVEERAGRKFVKINQSCIVNVDKIERFSASLGGSLMVTLKNGYRDYVSRRQIKAVKERIGFHL